MSESKRIKADYEHFLRTGDDYPHHQRALRQGKIRALCLWFFLVRCNRVWIVCFGFYLRGDEMMKIKFRIWNMTGNCMHEWPELVEKNKIPC
jgi:hypothetical protein